MVSRQDKAIKVKHITQKDEININLHSFYLLPRLDNQDSVNQIKPCSNSILVTLHQYYRSPTNYASSIMLHRLGPKCSRFNSKYFFDSCPTPTLWKECHVRINYIFSQICQQNAAPCHTNRLFARVGRIPKWRLGAETASRSCICGLVSPFRHPSYSFVPGLK